MFQLTIQSPEGETNSYLLNREHITLGSNPQCDILIPSPLVAPLAARLNWEEGQGFRLLTAPGQRSFTVNDQPVLSAILEDGDQIRAGEFLCTLQAVADTPSTTWDLPDDEPAAGGDQPANEEVSPVQETGELAELHTQLEALRQSLHDTSAQLQQARSENRALREEIAAVRAAAGSAHQIPELQQRIAILEKRVRDTEAEARRRVERAHETMASLRRALTRQDGELREQRENLLRLQQAKNAAETQLESVRKSYSRDRKQHGRLLDQFRERARRETARADMALDELARTIQSNEEPD